MSFSKILGMFDIIAAIFLWSGAIGSIGKIKYVIMIILGEKGFMATITGHPLLILYGVVDLLTIVFLWFNPVSSVFGIKTFLIVMLVIKGIHSMFS